MRGKLALATLPLLLPLASWAAALQAAALQAAASAQRRSGACSTCSARAAGGFKLMGDKAWGLLRRLGLLQPLAARQRLAPSGSAWLPFFPPPVMHVQYFLQRSQFPPLNHAAQYSNLT